MKKIINDTHIEGRIYDHKLQSKVSGPNSKNPGTEFINGTIDIATDDACLNIVTVHFSYVTAVTAKGSPNATYNVLKSIIDGKINTCMAGGKDAAGMVRIDSAIGLNDFYNREGELVSPKRNEGGFVHTTNELASDEKKRATFKTDMVITKVRRVEADEERQMPEKVIVSGAIFDFRNALLPVEFSATNAAAMNYFESLEASASKPVFTCVWGEQVSQTVIRTFTEESAFGDPTIREVKSSVKDYVITGAAPETYLWDDESSILASELTKAMSEREIYLADVKKRQDEYNATRNQAPSAIASTPSTGGATYNF